MATFKSDLHHQQGVRCDSLIELTDTGGRLVNNDVQDIFATLLLNLHGVCYFEGHKNLHLSDWKTHASNYRLNCIRQKSISVSCGKWDQLCKLNTFLKCFVYQKLLLSGHIFTFSQNVNHHYKIFSQLIVIGLGETWHLASLPFLLSSACSRSWPAQYFRQSIVCIFSADNYYTWRSPTMVANGIQ